MSDRQPPEPLDPRVHAALDAGTSESHLSDGALHSGTTLDNRLIVLRRIEAWLQATRPRSPSYLADSVQTLLEADRTVLTRPSAPSGAAPPAAGVVPFPASKSRLRAWRWAAIPAAAAALVAVVFSLRPPETPPEAPLRVQEKTVSEANLETVGYTFLIRTEDAKKVCLVGDFNQWKICDVPLVRVEEDLWSISLELSRGRYEYMFVVDGAWVTDPGATAYVEDGFGNKNAVLVL